MPPPRERRSTRFVSRVSGGAILLLAACAACAACASAAPAGIRANLRDSTPAEARLVREALTPLLRALDEPIETTPDCGIAVGIAVSPRINASIGRPTTGSCPRFAIVLTEGAVTRLPVGMLRAVLAHEVGHFVLNHRGANSQAKEREADEFATRLLKRLESRYPDACVQLVYVFSVLAEPGSAAWFAAHPSPDRRAEAALARCNQ